MSRTVYIVFTIIAALCFELGDAIADETRPPNILIITVDNLGYGDLQSYNPDSTIQTPNLDAFARQGTRLTSFYTASPTCTVSRACLLTGRIPQRHGLNIQLPGIEGNYGIGLDQDEILIPQVLKMAPVPYVTGCFGKWNIGFAPGSRPTERGFDEFLGHASGNIDYYAHVYNGKHDLFRGIEPYDASGTYSPDLFADAAIDFLRRHSTSKQPWFCYLPLNSPHSPNIKNKAPGQKAEWQAPDWAFQKYGMTPDEPSPEKRYRAVVTALDRAIGCVLDSLKQAGVEEETFVFLFSDNGAFRLDREGIDIGSNLPLRSGGVTCWEGGLRVVAMARWPEQIPAGAILDEPLWSPDLFIACTQLAGAKLPEQVVFDGKDPLPVLTGKTPSPHKSFNFQFRKHSALRKGNWKIVREAPEQSWMLFNLKKDFTEKKDLADSHPTQVKELQAEFDSWERSFAKQTSAE